MARQPVTVLSVARLTFGLSPRANDFDPHHVKSLTEVLDQLPPILVHASTLQVIDGVHRVLATRAAGRATIRAVLFNGDQTAARIEAVRSNVAHGKPLSLAEREAAAVGIIESVPQWSDRRIAMVSGLSATTVGRLRGRATVHSDQSRARLGRDGRLRPLDPGEVRLRVARALQDDPDASVRAIARCTGASQGTVRDVRDRLHQGLEVVPPSGRPRNVPAQRGSTAGAPERESVDSGLPPEFCSWFDQHRVDNGSWRRFVGTVPISRVYEVADACRRVSDSWRALSVALEDRARTRRGKKHD